MIQLESHNSQLPMFVYGLKLQCHSNETTALTLPAQRSSVRLDFTCIHVAVQLSINRACPLLAQWMTQNKKNKNKNNKTACTFNCTGLHVCLKVTIHKYAQVHNSQCIAHLWQNWVLVVKTNGHGSNEVPNDLILNRCRQAKTHSPSMLCILELNFQTSNKCRKHHKYK